MVPKVRDSQWSLVAGFALFFGGAILFMPEGTSLIAGAMVVAGLCLLLARRWN